MLASGSRGYAAYLAAGELSADTVRRVERSENMAVYRDIFANGPASRSE